MSGFAGPAAIKAGKFLHAQMKSSKGAAEAFTTSKMSDGETLVDDLNGNGAKERRRQVRCPPHTHTPSPDSHCDPTLKCGQCGWRGCALPCLAGSVEGDPSYDTPSLAWVSMWESHLVGGIIPPHASHHMHSNLLLFSPPVADA